MDLFEKFEIDDSFILPEERKYILSKLMHEAGNVSEQVFIDSHNGLQEINGKLVYITGEHILPDKLVSDMPNIITHDIMASIDYADRSEIIKDCSAYINLLPGTTEILFYASLFTVVKPFLARLNIHSGLLLSLAGPPEHLKTTLARIYALWYSDQEALETSFHSHQREQNLLDTLNGLSGQNFLIDDMHKMSDANAFKRQEHRLDVVARHINTQKTCANVIITGEPMERIGIFSCMDRIFQLKIPHMDAEEIELLKKKISDLPPNLMPSIALAFARSLMNDTDKTMRDISDFYNKNIINTNANGYATRIHRHALFIRMTEYLFNKYFEQLPKILGDKTSFEHALAEQVRLYEADLQKIRATEDIKDYIFDLYEILNSSQKYIKICANSNDYLQTNMENSCMLYRDKIYITTTSLINAFRSYYEAYTELKSITDAFHNAGLLEEEQSSRGRQKNYLGKKHYVININLFITYLNKKGFLRKGEYEKWKTQQILPSPNYA